MFDNVYRDELKYKEYLGVNDSQQETFAPERIIKGLRLKGNYKTTTGKEGDSTTCNISYKTPERLIQGSEINGRVIMECVKVAGLGHNCGYVSYVK